MKSKMKNRIGLLSILLVTGLLLVSIGTALGAGEALKFAGKEIRAVAMDDEVALYEDGKLIEKFPLSESENYILETSDHKIVMGKMTQEEMEQRQAEHEAEMNKWLEIVNEDSRVQELTGGKDIEYKGEEYSVIGAMNTEEEVVLIVDIEGRFYEITIDLDSETVESVEEQSSGVRSYCYGPDGPIDCNELPPTARYWKKVQ